MEGSVSAEPTSTSAVRTNQTSVFADNGRKNTSSSVEKHEHTDQMTCDSTLTEAVPKNVTEQAPIDPKDITIRPAPVFRCPGRGRWTNQLKYLLNTVIKPILNLKCSRYFKAPVDPITLRVPNYYDVITNPMDLGTIKKRLENNYYMNAQECIDDVNLVLRNCYTFNKPEHFVFLEGRQMEDQFKKRIGKMPFDEEEIPFALKASSFASPKKKSVPNVPSNKLAPRVNTDPVTTVVEQTEADSASPSVIEPHPSPPPLEDARTPQPFMTCDDELSEEALQPPPLTPAPIVDEEAVSNDSSSQAVSQSGLPSLECVDTRRSPECPVSSAADDNAVVHSTQEDEPLNLATVSDDVSKPLVVSVEESKDDDFSASDTSVALDGNEIPDVSAQVITSSVRPPFAVQPSKTKKGVKRKADTTTPNTPGPWKSGSLYNEDLMGTARTSTRKIKPPNKELPGEDEPFGKAFKKSPLSSQLRFCSNLIKEMLGKSHYEYAWPFHDPVDVEKWNLPDYLEKIKRPMDLGTVKTKIDNRLYKSPSEFAADVRLIFSNCYQYNPSDNPVYIMAQRLHNVFESKFAKLPSKSPSSPVSTGAYASNNHHNRHNHLNHHHNHHHRTPTSTVTSSHSSTPSSATATTHPEEGGGNNSSGGGSSKSSLSSSGKPKKAAAATQHNETRSSSNSSSTSNHTDGRKSVKYHKSSHTPNTTTPVDNDLSTSVSSTNTYPQHKNNDPVSTPATSAPKATPKAPPQPEYPDANTIAALQQQLQAVMHQLAVIQQRGLQSDDKERDANNIQTKLNNLTGAQKKPRAPKKPRKSNVSETHTAAAETSSASADDLNATSSSSVSTAAAATLPKLEPGATETNSNSHIKTEPMSPQGAINNVQSSAMTNHSMTSTTVSTFATADPCDLGPGQLPLTSAPPPSAASCTVSSSVSGVTGGAASQPSSLATSSVKVNANSSALSNHTSTAAADYQQSHINQNSGNSVTPASNKGNRKRGKASNECTPATTNPQSVKKSTLKKTTKMSRPQDNKLLDSDEEENATDMTYEEKRQLSSNIDRLTKPQLYRVVHILRAHEPQLQNADVAEITLDLETVKAVTLRALEKFVNQCLKAKKPRAAPPPKKQAPPPVETLPLREYESRKEELVRKIEELGGKKSSKTYEKELGEGYNLDPVNRGISRLSDGSSSEDSDSSSSDGGSSDSDDSRDDSSDNSDSPQGGGGSNSSSGANRLISVAALSSKNAKRKSSPHKHSQLINNGAKHFQPPNSTASKTGGPVVGSAFANLAVGLVNSGSRTCSPKSNISSPTSSFDRLKQESGASMGAGGAAGSGGGGGGMGSSNSISANVTKVLSTWGSGGFTSAASSTTTSASSSSTSATSSVNSSLLFQQYKKQALERTQLEKQIKAKQKLNEISRKPLESAKAPNLSESEDESQPSSIDMGKSSNKGLNDSTDGFAIKSSPPHVVDLNEQMNLLDSFEKSTTSISLSSPSHF